MNKHVLQIVKVDFSYTIWFTISEKNITKYKFLCCRASVHQKSQQVIQKNCAPEIPIVSALKLRSCGLFVFIDMNTIYLKKTGISKHF